MDHQYDRGRSPTRSPTRSPLRDVSRSRSRSHSGTPPPRRRHDSRSRSLRSRSVYSRSRSRRGRSRSPYSRYSRSPTPRRNGRHGSRSPSRGRDRSHSADRKPTKIVIERLTKNVQEDHLHEIFGHYGEIVDLHLPINRQFNTNRGTAYLLYKSAEDAIAASASMHEGTIDGSVVHVSVCLPRTTFPAGAIPVARRGATNIDPRVPPPNRRGAGGRGFGGPQRRRGATPPGRYGPRYDIYRPRSESRSDGGKYRSRSRSYDERRDRSRSPGRRGGGGRGGRRKRSLSRGSYGSYRDRSPSRSRVGRH